MTTNRQLVPGQMIGNIEVIKLDHIKTVVRNTGTKINKEYYLCRCHCGKEFIAYKHNLTRNVDRIESCGCIKGTHHHSKDRVMKIFYGMKKRTTNPNCEDYVNYGLRGIKVCDEWLNDPELFYTWAMNNGYSDDLTIDRIDNNKGYSPDNCRWVDKKVQSQNRRCVKVIDIDNISYTIEDIANELGLKHSTVYMRLKRQGILNLSEEEKQVLFTKPNLFDKWCREVFYERERHNE